MKKVLFLGVHYGAGTIYTTAPFGAGVKSWAIQEFVHDKVRDVGTSTLSENVAHLAVAMLAEKKLTPSFCRAFRLEVHQNGIVEVRLSKPLEQILSQFGRKIDLAESKFERVETCWWSGDLSANTSAEYSPELLALRLGDRWEIVEQVVQHVFVKN